MTLAACAPGAANQQRTDPGARFALTREGPADCGPRLLPEVVKPSLDRGLVCLRRIGAARRLAEFEALLAGPPIAVECGADAQGYRALAHAAVATKGAGPRIEVSRRMLAELASSPDARDQHSLFFHESIHLLDARYTHDYRFDSADVAVSCEACCFPERGQRGGYLDRAAVTPDDRRRHCRACADPAAPGSTDPAYWGMLLRQSLPKNRAAFFLDPFLRSLDARPDAAPGDALEAARWPALVCDAARESRLDASLYGPRARSLLAQRCPDEFNATRKEPAGP